MDFRTLTLDDLPAVLELENSLPNSVLWFPADSEYHQKIIINSLGFGIFDNDNLIGKVGFTLEHEGVFEVDGMIVKKSYRNQGIGKKLFSFALKELFNKKHPIAIILFTHPENTTAISLYKQFGFVTKELIPNKYGPGFHRIRIEKLYKSH